MKRSIEYSVKTKHTKKLLKDFVNFSFRVNHPKTTLRLCVVGCGFLIIALGMEKNSVSMWMCIAIGVLLWVFAFTRHNIGVMQLKENDEIYKNDWEVDVSFGDKDIYIKNSGEQEGITKLYSEVAAVYMDETYYYIGFVGDNLYPLPRMKFEKGKQELFAEFIRKKTGKLIMYVPAKMKNKFQIIREKMKKKEEEHDFKIEKKKE